MITLFRPPAAAARQTRPAAGRREPPWSRGHPAASARLSPSLLQQEGYQVYGGARRTDRMEHLREHGIRPLAVDVTSEESMRNRGGAHPRRRRAGSACW